MTLQTRIMEVVAPEFVRKIADLEADCDQARGEVSQTQEEITQAQRENQILRDSLATFAGMISDRVISIRSPDTMIQELQEQGYDSGMLDLLIDQIGWETITSLSSAQDDDGRERQTMVDLAVRLFQYSPLAQWAIWLWTGWGLGDKITVTLEDDDAQKWWDEFITAERNEKITGADQLHKLSDWLLVKGNRFLVLFTATAGEEAGKTTVRILDQNEINIIRNPDDKMDVWFYRRQFTNGSNSSGTGDVVYYPDYSTLLGQGGILDKRWAILQKKQIVGEKDKRADLLQDATAACVFHIPHNEKNENSPWGWPITTASGAWVRGHKQFSEARLGVAMAISQFVRRSRVKGGSRAVASMISSIQSTLSRTNVLDQNPPAAAGAWDVENLASETKELPMRTGAQDAKADNEIFAWMASLGMGLFPTSMGLDTSRWATAVEMDKAQAMLFERYQRFWAAQFQRLVRLVLRLGDKWGPVSFTDEDTEAEISTDSFSLSDYPAVSEAVAAQVEKMLTPYVGTVIPADTAKALLAKLWRLSLDALGSGVGRDLTTDEAFGVGMEEPESTGITGPATGDDGDEEEPGMESSYIRTLGMALQNLQEDHITPDQFAEMMMAEIGEVYNEAQQA